MQFELDYFFCIHDFIQIIHKKVSDGQFIVLFNYICIVKISKRSLEHI